MSSINSFPILNGERTERPMQFYGLGVETGGVIAEAGEEDEFFVLDLIGAQWFQQRSDIAANGLSSPDWREELLVAPVAALEINPGGGHGRSLISEWGFVEG